MHISELVKEAWTTAEEKGFHSNKMSVGDRIALIHSEASEALEAFRAKKEGDRWWALQYGEGGKPEGVASELADIVIRVADMCGVYAIDLEDAIEKKMAYNKTRPHLHGKNF